MTILSAAFAGAPAPIRAAPAQRAAIVLFTQNRVFMCRSPLLPFAPFISPVFLLLRLAFVTPSKRGSDRSGVDLEIEFLRVQRRGRSDFSFVERRTGKRYAGGDTDIVNDVLDFAIAVERM